MAEDNSKIIAGEIKAFNDAMGEHIATKEFLDFLDATSKHFDTLNAFLTLTSSTIEREAKLDSKAIVTLSKYKPRGVYKYINGKLRLCCIFVLKVDGTEVEFEVCH